MRCLIKPLFKNTSPKQFFEGGTPWVTKILNNVIVSMVLYCAQKLLGEKKTDFRGKSIEIRLMPIEILTSVDYPKNCWGVGPSH